MTSFRKIYHPQLSTITATIIDERREQILKKEPFRKVGDSARNDYENGVPAAHTVFQVKGLALIANARKVGISLHFRQQLVPETRP